MEFTARLLPSLLPPLSPVSIPPSADPVTESFRYYACMVTKVSKLILSSQQQSRATGVLAARSSKNIVLYFPASSLEHDGELGAAATSKAAAESFVALCTRTLKSPRISSISLVVVDPPAPPTSSPPSATLLQHLQTCLLRSAEPNLALSVVDGVGALKQHLRKLTLPTLPKMTATFHLPRTAGDDTCAITLDLVPSVLPLPLGGEGAGSGEIPPALAQFLQPKSMRELEVVQMVSLAKRRRRRNKKRWNMLGSMMH